MKKESMHLMGINIKNIIKIFYQMKTFRRKYIYNPDNPIFESPNVRTFNCMNTQTKDKTLILLEHLNEIPFVEPSTTVLQPYEMPTESEPMSVYPIVRCVSQIGKLAQPEAMYVINCILEAKIKKPLYSVICKQGIVACNVEGVLPSKTPDLFQIAIDLLGLPSNLTEVDKSVVSKEGYSICRAIRDGDLGAVTFSLKQYGWKDIKKEKDQINDDEYIIFKGRRKEEGSILGEQYGLAWHNTNGMCKMKHISLVRDGYEEQFYKEFVEQMQFIKDNQNSDKSPFLKVYKYSKDFKGIKIFSEIANQGSLNDYIQKKHESGKSLNEKNTLSILEKFVQSMIFFSKAYKPRGLSTLHIKQLYVHNNRILIGEPFLITDKAEKKLRDLKPTMDYYAPEFKENMILPENMMKLNREKMDVWSFGFVLHKIFARQMPIFDPSKNPIINKSISPGMAEFIKECLSLKNQERPSWMDIKLKDIDKKAVKIEEVKEDKAERENIRLGSRSDKRSEKPKSPQKKSRIVEQYREEEPNKVEEQGEKLKVQQEEEQAGPPVPAQISSRLKKIKLVLKIIIILCAYIFIFFRPFFANSIDILTVRSFYTTTSLHLVDYDGVKLSSTTVLTDDPLFFLQNDISFADVQNNYHCIDDHFDPIYNPDYSLLSYLQSADFLALLLTGWLTAIIICVLKAVSIWKGGISNRPRKSLCKYWVIYGFHELSLAALLFAHFYIYQFFYFSGATPCLSISNFTDLEPFFDSTLYLFLSNTEGYFQLVFSTLGVFSIILSLSVLFYSCAPKLDIKYFISIPSILFRIIPFLLFLLICRIGVFDLFSPTAINDATSILPAIINNSIQGFIGIIPQVFIIACVVVEVLLELFMVWCEGKASENDKLAKLFNVRKRKIERDESSVLEKSYQGINDMSIINNSKHKLDISSIDQY